MFEEQFVPLSPITSHPSLISPSFAHDTLCDFMERHGFVVTRHYLGLETAWRAEFTHGSGGRTLGINSEMDALPLIGHACGHNLIAVSGVGVAIAVQSALQTYDVPGRIILLGTPGKFCPGDKEHLPTVGNHTGEEGGGGKAMLLERGGYKDMDVCLMSVPIGIFLGGHCLMGLFAGVTLRQAPRIRRRWEVVWPCSRSKRSSPGTRE